jgi:signal transduction histidine kinase
MKDQRASIVTEKIHWQPDSRTARQVQLHWLASIGIFEIRLRLVAGLSALGATWFSTTVLRADLPALPLYLIGLSLLVYNALLWLYLNRRLAFPSRVRSHSEDDQRLSRHFWMGGEQEDASWIERFDRFVHVQVLCDWLAVILLVHYTGGVESPLLFFFMFHLIAASVVLSRRESYTVATLSVALLSFLALAEFWGYVPHECLGLGDNDLYRNGLYVSAVLLFFAISQFIIVYLVTMLTQGVRRKDEELIRAQHSLTSAYQVIETLYDVTRTASSTLHLDQVLQLVVQGAVEAMQVKAAAVLLIGDSEGQVNIAAAHGLSEEYVNKGTLDISQSRCLREPLATGEPTFVPDVALEDELQYRFEMQSEGLVSALCVPLLLRGVPQGVVAVYSGEPGGFEESDAEFLTALAGASAGAIDNARAYEALEAADRARSNFVRLLTHEFRSPLSAVQTMLGLMEQGIVGSMTDKQTDLVQRSKRRIQHLLDMVADLLELAAGKMTMLQTTKSEVDINQLLCQAMDDIRATAEAKGLDCRLEVGEEPLIVSGFEEGLARVFSNLVTNAVKYTPQGGVVEASARRRGDEIAVEITDTGIGIPQEALPRLFTEFYRARNAKAISAEGTGLGLVIAKDVVEQHGGQIGIQSKVGEGSVFTVILPTG